MLAAALAGMLCACAHLDGSSPRPQPDRRLAVPHAIQEVKQKYAPDNRLGIFDVGVQHRGLELVLTGEVDCAEARIETVRAVERTGAKVTDRIKVLPDREAGGPGVGHLLPERRQRPRAAGAQGGDGHAGIDGQCGARLEAIH